MTNLSNDLSRAEKILLFLYELGKGQAIKTRYEDIVVGVFKKYPHDFHLKGYTEFPDSGDTVHKPLYDFKKKGYINAASKVFVLTERGLELAKSLTGKGDASVKTRNRLSRSTETEVARVKVLEGFELFLKSQANKLSDDDFYNYLGVTVRTPKAAFQGRLETMKAVKKELQSHLTDPLYLKLTEYHDLLLEKNSRIVDFFTEKK